MYHLKRKLAEGVGSRKGRSVSILVILRKVLAGGKKEENKGK